MNFSVSHSRWDENPQIYFLCKRVWSSVVSFIFPFAHYCVLSKSPRNFGSLKWFLYFHVFWISVEWFSNSLFIDIYDFEPSVIIRIDGISKHFIDSVLLFRMYCFFESMSSTSALILFCSRLLLIFNMYRRHTSTLRRTVEYLIYILVCLFGLWSLPLTLSMVPNDQKSAKQHIISTEDFYPDCIMSSFCVVVSNPSTDSEDLDAIIGIANWVSIAVAIFVFSKVAFCLLERRMFNISRATRRMHQKFNQRTVFQAMIYLFFGSIPFTLLYGSILLRVHVPGLTFFIDFFSENHPTACAITLFLYYDPYQNYLLKVLKFRSVTNLPKTTINVDKTTMIKI